MHFSALLSSLGLTIKDDNNDNDDIVIAILQEYCSISTHFENLKLAHL